MDILKLPCFLLCLLLLLHIISATSCSVSSCGFQTIRYPFHLNQENPNNYCYPGFTLTCKAPQNNTILTLPGSGEFLVQEINYHTQTMLVYDHAKCLPNRLAGGFNLSDSPFMANLSTSYTLYSCPRQFERLGFPTIRCLSNTTSSVLALLNVAAVVSKRCQEIDTLMVPTGNLTAFFMGDAGLHLKWRLPQCQDCEGNGGKCGFDDRKQIVCNFLHPNKGGSTGEQVLKIIALSIGIPATICAISVAAFQCILDTSSSSSSISAVNPQPGGTSRQHSSGLEQATIDTYAKMVVGESKRVPGPNDDTCPICLSEFKTKDSLRCIPHCQHCFHADCIDEWLRIRATCPLCRELPSLLVHQTS